MGLFQVKALGFEVLKHHLNAPSFLCVKLHVYYVSKYNFNSLLFLVYLLSFSCSYSQALHSQYGYIIQLTFL